MSGAGGVSMARPARGENRFYVSPAMRRHREQKAPPAAPKRVEADDPDQCGPASNCSVSGRVGREGAATDPNLTNLDRFLVHTTPVVPAQFLPKRSTRGWRRTHDVKEPQAPQSFFVLGDLWESFKEWSAYGAGVPVVLNGSDTVVQYYVPYLSGIQIYIPYLSRPGPRLRRHGEDSDAESSRETSSDGGSEYGSELIGSRGPWNQQSADAKSWSRGRPGNSRDSSSDESEMSSLHGQLVFEYLEHASPFTREPLADKISALASQFPQLKTYRSCDISPSSWISVAWYPIYRIPMGPTLQNLDACFLTFHSLSTPSHGQNSDAMHPRGSSFREVHRRDTPSMLHLPTFGLASYKFKVSFWNPNGVYESKKVNSLLQAADNWLRLLEVSHPDYRFFVSHGSNWR